MRCSWWLPCYTVSERDARIRVLVVAIHSSRSISGPTAAPAISRDCIGCLLFQVRQIFVLVLCARLGARNLAAAWPATNSRPGRRSERPFVCCVFHCLFAFGGQLVAASAHLHRPRSVCAVLDGCDRRVLGRAENITRARSPVDALSRPCWARGQQVAGSPALAGGKASRSGDG